jgi:energy-converting hydrogenase B subunit D
MILEIALVLLVIFTVAAVMIKDLVHAVILLAIADALLAVGFYMMGAPDIALTQSAVVAGLSTFIFMIAINKTRRME